MFLDNDRFLSCEIDQSSEAVFGIFGRHDRHGFSLLSESFADSGQFGHFIKREARAILLKKTESRSAEAARRGCRRICHGSEEAEPPALMLAKHAHKGPETPLWRAELLPGLARTLGRMSGPMMLNDAAVQLHRGIYGSGPQHLDVPERNPNRSVLTGQNSGPMRSAEALHVPEGIPLPQPDGSSPYGEGLPSAFGMPPMPMRRPRF